MSMRTGEEAHDYRYFPDPDLVPVQHITDEQLESWKASLPELPAQRRRRFADEWKLPEQDADIITSDCAQADLFEAAALYNEPRKIANYMTGPCSARSTGPAWSSKTPPSSPKPCRTPIVDGGLISARSRRIFSVNCTPTASCPKPTSVKRPVQVSDTSAIDAAVAEVIAENRRSRSLQGQDQASCLSGRSCAR